MALLSVTSFAALLVDQLTDSLVFTQESLEVEKDLERKQTFKGLAANPLSIDSVLFSPISAID